MADKKRELELTVKARLDQGSVNKVADEFEGKIGEPTIKAQLDTSEINKSLKEIKGAIEGVQKIFANGFSVSGTDEVNKSFNSMCDTIDRLSEKLGELHKDGKQTGGIVDASEVKIADGQLNSLANTLNTIKNTTNQIRNRTANSFLITEGIEKSTRQLQEYRDALQDIYKFEYKSKSKKGPKLLSSYDDSIESQEDFVRGLSILKDRFQEFGKEGKSEKAFAKYLSGSSTAANAFKQIASKVAFEGVESLDKTITFIENGTEKVITYREAIESVISKIKDYAKTGESFENVAKRIFQAQDTKAHSPALGFFTNVEQILAKERELKIYEKDLASAQNRETKIFDDKTVKNLSEVIQKLNDFLGKKKDLQSITTTFESLSSVMEQISKAFDNTTTSVEAISKESEEAKQGATSFEDMAEAKKKFAEANKQVATTATESAGKIDKEAQSAKEAANVVGKTSSQTKNGSTLQGKAKLFLDPKKDADEWDKATKAAFRYKKEIGEIQKIRRGVDSKGQAYYDIYGANGQKVHLTANDRGKLVGSKPNQELYNKTAQDKTAEEKRIKREADAKEKAAKKEKEDLEIIKKRKNDILKYDKEIFELEQKMKQGQKRGDSANQTKVWQTQIDEATRQRDNNRRALQRFMSSRGMNKEYDDFSAQRDENKRIRNQRAANKEQVELSKNRSALAEDLNKLQSQLDEIKNNTTFNAIKEAADLADNSINNLAQDLSKINSQNDFDKVKESFKGLSDSVNEIKQLERNLGALDSFADSDKYTTKFKNEVKETRKEIKELIDSANNVDELKAAFDRATNSVTDFNKKAEDTNNILAKEQSVQKIRSNIEKFIEDNTKMGRKMQEQFKGLTFKLDGTEVTKAQLDSVIADFARLKGEIYSTGKAGKSMFDTFRGRIKQMSTNFVAMYFSFYDIIRYIRQTVSAVTEIDSAMTELRKVSDASSERIAQNFEVSAKAAQDLGSTIKDVINITADWSRLNISGLIKLAQIGGLPEVDNTEGKVCI